MLEILGDLIAQRLKEANAAAQAQAQDRARLAAAARGRGMAPSAPPQQPPIVVRRPAAPPAPEPIEEFPTAAVFADPITGGSPASRPAPARPALLADFSGAGLLGAIVLAEALAKPLALRDEGPRF